MRIVSRFPLAIAVLAALALAACQGAAPPASKPGDDLSPLVRDAYPCPYGMVDNIVEGNDSPVSELNAAGFGGPAGFPELTKGYHASCVFRYTEPVAVQAYFIGMGPDFVMEMAKRLKKYGFTLVQSNNDLPRDWELDGLQLSVDRRFADDVTVPNVTFDRDFVIITVFE